MSPEHTLPPNSVRGWGRWDQLQACSGWDWQACSTPPGRGPPPSCLPLRPPFLGSPDSGMAQASRQGHICSCSGIADQRLLAGACLGPPCLVVRDATRMGLGRTEAPGTAPSCPSIPHIWGTGKEAGGWGGGPLQGAAFPTFRALFQRTSQDKNQKTGTGRAFRVLGLSTWRGARRVPVSLAPDPSHPCQPCLQEGRLEGGKPPIDACLFLGGPVEPQGTGDSVLPHSLLFCFVFTLQRSSRQGTPKRPHSTVKPKARMFLS